MNEKRHSDALPPDLVSTIQLYLDGEIGEDAFIELQALMDRSPEARTLYRSYTKMDANLREIAEESGSEEVVSLSRGGRSGVGASLLQAAATFVLGAVAVYLIVGRNADAGKVAESARSVEPRFIPSGMIDNGLAVLTKAVGVRWGDGATAYTVKDFLPNGTLKIEKGLLQIEFFSGAIVIVEGPAEFELVDPMHAICHFGRTRANVPETAQGFTMASEKMRVVDLGTEFALVVERDGSGEVHVFEGAVELHEQPGGSMHTVKAGNGVRFGDSAPEFLPLNEMGFPDEQHVSVLANAEADEHRARWEVYSEELKAHQDVLLYYSFDEKTSWSRELRNVRKMTASPLHGAIVGCRWSEGRWNGKGSLEFKGAGDRVRIQIPGKHDQFTLMAWVRIDGFDRDLNSLMLSDNWIPGGVHWQFTRDGELILGVKHETESGHYQSEPILNQSHLGRWIQLAVSYDSVAKRVGHYVNGQLVWKGDIEHHVAISAPRGELGNWRTDYQQTGSNIRNLNGRMDEFVVFSRGLPDTEIRRFYERGKPHS